MADGRNRQPNQGGGPRRSRRAGRENARPSEKGATPSERAIGGSRLIEAAAVVLIAIAAYANTIHADFTLDDVPIIKENEPIRSMANIGKFFTTNYWGEKANLNDKSLYRPLTIASYAFNYAIHGLSPTGYHVVNIAMHACVCLLLYALVLALFGEPQLALLSGVLFAVHPIHTEVVAGIVGRAEIMALLGGLLCCLSYVLATRDEGWAARRGRWAWVAISTGGYAFGVFSKEIGFIAPLLIVAWEVIFPQKRRLLRADIRAIAAFAGYSIVGVVYLMMRAAAVQTNNINVGFIGVTTIERIWTSLRVCMEYVGLLLAPVRLSADYWKTDVPISRTPKEFAVLGAIALLMLVLALIVWCWRKRPAAAWGICAFLTMLFPVSNLPFRIGVMKAERVLYSPSLGFVVALAALATWMTSRWRWIPHGAVWLMSLLFIIRTWVRNEDWRDNLTLAEVTLRVSPHSPIFHTIMASACRQQKQNSLAREHLLESIEAQPNSTALFNLGNLELDEKRYDEAIGYYRRALELQPQYLSALNNLGRALAESGKLWDAVKVLEQSRSLRPDNPGAYVNLLSIYIQLKEIKTGLPLAEEAQRRFPNVAVVHWNAGSIYYLAGRQKDGEAAYRRARELDPQVEHKGDIKVPIE